MKALHLTPNMKEYMMKYANAEEAYHSVLETVLNEGEDDGEGNLEIIGLNFVVEDLSTVEFNNPIRNFKTKFAQKFFDFIMSGGTDASVLFKDNPNAKNFVDDLASRNTAYGPRIIAQMPKLIEEIKNRPATRRAVLTILNQKDQVLLAEKRDGSKMEYPCTMTLVFFLRNNKLHQHVFMRSNNMTTTVNYDLFNFISFQRYLVYRLNEVGVKCELGNYHHACASAHILKDEIDLAKKIVKSAAVTI